MTANWMWFILGLLLIGGVLFIILLDIYLKEKRARIDEDILQILHELQSSLGLPYSRNFSAYSLKEIKTRVSEIIGATKNDNQ